MARVSIILGVFVAFTVASVYCEHDRRDVGAILCGFGKVFRGRSNTIQDMCDHTLRVLDINNLTLFPQDDFPWEFMVDVTEEGESPISLTSTINLIDLTDDNIAGLVASDVLLLTEGHCDNRVISVIFTLTSQDASKMFQRKLKRRILCDFDGVDLSLSIPGVVPPMLPDITLSGSTTLAEAMTQGFDFTVTASNIGTDPIPSLQAPADSQGLPLLQPGYFLSAFIKRFDDSVVLEQDQCSTNADSMLPEITAKDLVIESAHFTNDATLESIDVLGMLRANTMTLDLCGEHVLVLFLDSLHTAVNEDNRCNNFLTIRIHSTKSCDTITPQCQLTLNPWTSDDMRVVFSGADTAGPVARMFQFEEQGGGFKESDGYDWLEDNGYGRLAIFTDYIKKHHAVDAGACSSLSGPLEQLQEIEGDDDADSPIIASVTFPAEYILAKAKLVELSTDPSLASSIKAEMEIAQNNLVVTTQMDLREKVLHNISATALQTVINATIEILSITPAGMGPDHCHLPWEMDWAKWLHNAKKSYIEHDLLSLAGKVSAASLANPEWTCLEKFLKNLIHYAVTAAAMNADEQVPATFMFDDESNQNESPDRLDRCGDSNKCIRKLQRTCKMKEITNKEPMDTSADEICTMLIMKRSAMSLYKALGMTDLIEDMQENDEMEGRYCGRDPLEPRQGPVTLWRFKDDNHGQSVLSIGLSDMENGEIAWKKMAVCRCASCGNQEEPTENTEPVMKRRRRRRK